MRVLKFLVVLMGVMIVVGTTTLVVLVVQRGAFSGGGSGTAHSGPIERLLDEPVGTTIARIEAAGDRVAVHLHGGGPDRVLLIDPRTGLITARVGLLR